MPVNAMVNTSPLRENSLGCLLLWGPCPLSAALASLQMKIQRIIPMTNEKKNEKIRTTNRLPPITIILKQGMCNTKQ